MKKLVISLAFVTLAGCIVEVQAFKKVSAPKPSGVTGAPTTKPVSGVKPIPKAVVITEAQKAQLEKDFEKHLKDMQNLMARVADLSMSLGNQEDAQAFLDEMGPRFEAISKKYPKPKELDISSLPSKATLEAQSRPVQKALAQADKEALLKLAKTWKQQDVYAKYQEYLDSHNLMFDDMFFGQLSNAAIE